MSPEGFFENSGSRIRYLTPLPPSAFPIDLNNGNITTTTDIADEPRYLDNMLRFIKASKEKFLKYTEHQPKVLYVNMEFICTREVMRLIACAPYDTKTNWTLAISKYRQNIYIAKVPNEARPFCGFDQDAAKQLIKANWLKKLRKHCLMSLANNIVLPDSYEQKEECGQYYAVYSILFDGMSILFDAPVLAEQCPNSFISEPKKFLELQLRPGSMNRAEWAVHNRDESIQWWVESFFIGAQGIYIADHDERGFVHRIRNHEMRAFRKECERDWAPHFCANFLARFLRKIKEIMLPVDSASTVYLFDFDAKNGIITYRPETAGNEHTFIPDWYRLLMEESLCFN
ncbi:protein cutoff [Drosophila busckii]|uniref:protein cutoff n=1 Tax=Drosophila busckii TaxID=30019 RepID=UPI00083F2139|nr:protein cutoff [Drosophila busckii]